MNKDIKKLPKSQLELTISVSWDVWKKYLATAVKEASKEIKIAGFRPGKAPKNLVEQKVGKAVLLNNSAEKAIKKSYADYILKEKLEVIGSPKIDLISNEEGKDLKYKVIISVMPGIKIESSYQKAMKKINEEFNQKSFKIEDKELDLELEKLANSRVKLVTVNREARKNDSVEIDFSVLREGVPIENGTSKKHPLIIGKGVFIPGFEEKIIGMKAGEEKEFNLSFPSEYHQKDLAGKPATFKVKMGLVQERQIPEINDDFAKSLGKFEKVDALKKSLREGMEHENKRKIKEEKRSKYLEEIVNHCQVELPEILVTEEIEKMIGELEYQIQASGMNIDQYLAQIKKTKEELKKEWEPQAKKRVISALALSEIAKEQDIKIENSEVEAEMNKTLNHYKGVKDIKKNIDMKRLYSYSKSLLENEKVFEWLEKL